MRPADVKQRFAGAAVQSGGVFLLQARDALSFIGECRVANIPILGIDCFRVLEDRKIQPVQEHGMDFDSENSHGQAKEFVEERLTTGLWFEVVAAHSA